MPSLAELSQKPPQAVTDDQFGPWFAALAGHLLNRVDLVAAGKPYHIAELEAYYFGPGHPDPFTHRDPVQLRRTRWYFHRTAGEYRGGSFKGVDLTFGDGTAMFGMLVRSLVAADGTLTDGPSLTVDHLLTRIGFGSVADLDSAIAGRPAWDAESPLSIREANPPRDAEVSQSARVGLSLKRSRGNRDAPKYVMRPYRYLTEPRRITKGKPQLVLALHREGKDTATIQQLTGVARSVIERYVADFAAGKREADFTRYISEELTTAERCRLLGTWAAHFG